MKFALAPRAASPSRVASPSASRSMSFTTTSKPAWAKAKALALPMPRRAPVTRAIFRSPKDLPPVRNLLLHGLAPEADEKSITQQIAGLSSRLAGLTDRAVDG